MKGDTEMDNAETERTNFGHFKGACDYETVFSMLERANDGETPRMIARSTGLSVQRVQEICQWMFDCDLANRMTLGTRLDPRNDSHRMPIYAYRVAGAATRDSLHDALVKHSRRAQKTYDGYPLEDAWRGVA